MERGAMRVAIYARVSTADQNPELQVRELRNYAERRGFVVHREYVDQASGDVRRKELGIDPKNAAKIEEIKRLRPRLELDEENAPGLAPMMLLLNREYNNDFNRPLKEPKALRYEQ